MTQGASMSREMAGVSAVKVRLWRAQSVVSAKRDLKADSQVKALPCSGLSRPKASLAPAFSPLAWKLTV